MNTLFGTTERINFATAPVDEIFAYYRGEGFPNYQRDDYAPSYELRKVRSADEGDYFDGLRFRKYSAANGFLFSYFPHWIDVRCGNSPSVAEAWKNDALLLGLINKTKTYCDKHGENWTENRFRQNAKVYCAKQSVSNFSPVCARILYDHFAPGGVVYDMSMGWGGRLLGFHASDAKTYIGCEPSTKTYAGLELLNADLSAITRKRAVLLNNGSEFADLGKWAGRIDFAFTSPPYFDTEKYSDEPTQSYIAYPTPTAWLEHFIRPTFAIVYAALRDGGVMAINYADNQMAQAIREVALAAGFNHETTLRYELSSIAGEGRKFEPIFIFRKGTGGRSIETETLFANG